MISIYWVIGIALAIGLFISLRNPNSRMHKDIQEWKGSSRSRVGMVLHGMGGVLVVVSIGWWYSTYADVPTALKSSAGNIECLFYATALCDAATTAAELAGRVAFHPFLTWIGLGLIVAGFVVRKV